MNYDDDEEYQEDEDDDEYEDDNDDSDFVYDFQGYFPGEKISFTYQKPGTAPATRTLCIESLIRTNGVTTHVYGTDLDDGNIKSFRTDRIDNTTVKEAVQ